MLLFESDPDSTFARII